MFSTLMVFTRRKILTVQGIIYYFKCEKIISEFKAENREDVDIENVPVLRFKEYPTLTDLNRFLRDNYGTKYPRYIESIDTNHRLLLKMIAVGDEFIEHKPGILNLNNGYGKIYTYEEYVIKNVF